MGFVKQSNIITQQRGSSHKHTPPSYKHSTLESNMLFEWSSTWVLKERRRVGQNRKIGTFSFAFFPSCGNAIYEDFYVIGMGIQPAKLSMQSWTCREIKQLIVGLSKEETGCVGQDRKIGKSSHTWCSKDIYEGIHFIGMGIQPAKLCMPFEWSSTWLLNWQRKR